MGYVGQTIPHFCITIEQQYFSKIFIPFLYVGFVEGSSSIFIHKTDPSDLLKREDHWRHTSKIIPTFFLIPNKVSKLTLVSLLLFS